MSSEWKKLGLIFMPDRTLPWMRSHCQAPAAFEVNKGTIRVYFASRDDQQISSIGYADVDPHTNAVKGYSKEPVISSGPIGFFDEHGVFPASVLRVGDKVYMYYIGWNKGWRTPLFYSSIGLAISEDEGKTFQKYSPAPIMGRSQFDPCLVTSPNVFKENGLYRMTYVSGVKWEETPGGLISYYHIKYAESEDGISWSRTGKVAIDFGEGETNIARSSVIIEQGVYKMWFCYIRGKEKYRIGYAESNDGISWQRNDKLAGIDVSENGFDSEMVCYPNIIVHGNKKLMFYNGNNYGSDGVALAVMTG